MSRPRLSLAERDSASTSGGGGGGVGHWSSRQGPSRTPFDRGRPVRTSRSSWARRCTGPADGSSGRSGRPTAHPLQTLRARKDGVRLKVVHHKGGNVWTPTPSASPRQVSGRMPGATAAGTSRPDQLREQLPGRRQQVDVEPPEPYEHRHLGRRRPPAEGRPLQPRTQQGQAVRHPVQPERLTDGPNRRRPATTPSSVGRRAHSPRVLAHPL
jgi:hypothetical protein